RERLRGGGEGGGGRGGREPVCRRCAPLALCPACVNDVRTASSRPKSRKAAMIDTSVSTVRVLRRKSAAQTMCRYFMPRPPRSGGRDRLDQSALVEVQDLVGVFRSLRVVRDHQDGLAVVAVQ